MWLLQRGKSENLRGLLPKAHGAWRELRAFTRYSTGPKRECETKFVILGGSGRSGSTLLVQMLDSMPDITCYHELLRIPLVAPLTYLRHHSDICETQAFGFKLLPYHLTLVQNLSEPIRLLDGLREAGYKFIYLYRDNTLMQVLSDLHSRDSREWHVRAGYEVNGVRAMPFDIKEILWRLDNFSQTNDFVKEFLAREPALAVVYEDDLQNQEDHEATVKRVADFLGVPFHVPTSSFKKRLPPQIDRIVENYDELVAALSGTQYERFLH